MDISDEKYCSYYFVLKKLYELHKKYQFGKSPDIPSGFSESLCRHILSLDKGNDRTHDAVDKDKNKIEIKATGTSEGKTTISNANKFDILYWIFIEFDTDSAHIYEFQFKDFELSGDSGRRSITLRTIASKNNIKPVIHHFKTSNEV